MHSSKHIYIHTFIYIYIHTFNPNIYCLKYEGHINKKQVKYQAAISISQTSTFYLLPKIHNTWTDSNTPPGRPLISDYGCVIQYISIYRLPLKTNCN